MFRRIIMLAIASMLAASFGIAHAQLPANARPDNTGLNARAKSASAVTADKQSNSKDDLELVARDYVSWFSLSEEDDNIDDESAFSE